VFPAESPNVKLEFGQSRVEVSTRISAIVTEVLHGFSQALEEGTTIAFLHQNVTRPFQSTSIN
jgi:hypothetical protein